MMKLSDSVLEDLRRRAEGYSKDNVSSYALINDLKDAYIAIIKDGYTKEDTFLQIASMLLYVGFLMDE